MKKYTCSFCNKPQTETAKMIVARGMNTNGENICVCSDCITMLYKMLEQEKEKESHNVELLKKPSEIKDWLDSYIISQDDAKKAVATALYEHQKQLKYNENLNKNQDALNRINLFVIGESGSGLFC